MANDVILQEGQPIDENLRPLKIGNISSSLELAQQDNGARVSGDLEITGNAACDSLSMIKKIDDTTAMETAVLNIDLDRKLASTSDNTMYGIKVDTYQQASSGTNTLYGVYSRASLQHNISGDPTVVAGYFHPIATPAGTSTSVGVLIDMDLLGDTKHGLQIRSAYNTSDFFSIAVANEGATTIKTEDADTAVAHLTIVADGHVEFDGCAVGFDLETPTYDATDTDVSFITGNKQFVTFDGGNITDLNLIFPETSGNFVLLLKQDGTGSRTVTNYKAWDLVNSDAADGSATVKFAGGSNPDLTDDANHVDIISIFWDADNQMAYGVASLDFQF